MFTRDEAYIRGRIELLTNRDPVANARIIRKLERQLHNLASSK